MATITVFRPDEKMTYKDARITRVLPGLIEFVEVDEKTFHRTSLPFETDEIIVKPEAKK